MTSLLEIEHLGISYSGARGATQVVDNFTATLAKGRTLGIVGESGSGKSTIALAVMGLLPENGRITGGSIRLAGEELVGMPGDARRRLRGRRLGMVFQDPFLSLNPALRVGLQVCEPLMAHRGYDRDKAMAEAVRLLDEVGIPRAGDVVQAYPHQLSGGMRQRTLIATALACNPEILVLDEPTTALDVTIEAQILDLLRSLQRERNLSMIFISHNLSVIEQIANDVAVFYAGRVVEQGDAQQVLSDALHPYTRGLLDALPRPGTRGHHLYTIPGSLRSSTDIKAGCNFAPRCRFRTDSCTSDEQEVREIRNGQKVRCDRAPLDLAARSVNGGSSGPAVSIPSSTAEPVIRIQSLSKSFAKRSLRDKLFSKSAKKLNMALDNISLEVMPGEILGLVGESGSGKSTLGRCIIGLERPDAGNIIVLGQELTKSDARTTRQTLLKTQMVFQNPSSSLNPRHQVGKMIGRAVLVSSKGEVSVRDRVKELLDLVRLPTEYIDRYPHQLSGGERQRVGIARALATNPDVLICDEAVSALDVSVQASIINLLDDLRKQLGVSILFISHDLAMVSHLADRVAVLYRGRLIEIGPTEKVMRAPNHPYTEALLSAVPVFERGGRIKLRGEISTGAVSDGCPFSSRCHRSLGEQCHSDYPAFQRDGERHLIGCHIPIDALAYNGT